MGFDVRSGSLQLLHIADAAALLQLRLHLRGQGVEVVVGRGLVVEKIGQGFVLHEKTPPRLVCAEVRFLCVVPRADENPSDGLFKVEVRVVLAVGAHTGGEHPVGGVVLPKALGHHPGESQVVQRPVGGGGKGLGAVAVTGVLRGDAAALLEAAAEVRGVQHHLTDEPPLQADGEVDGAAGGKVLTGHGVEVLVGQGPVAQVATVVVAPPAVALVVHAQGGVGGDVGLAEGCQGQALRFEGGDDLQHVQLGARLDAHLARQMVGQVLQFGGAQSLVPGVVLPVAPGAVAAVVPGEGLHQRGICPGVGVQRLLDVVHQRAAALLRQAYGHQPTLRQHTAGAEPACADQGEHLLRQHQLLYRQGAGLVELCRVVLPEGCQPGVGVVDQGGELRVGVVPAELVDMVTLAAVPPAGESRQLLCAVEIVLPRPLADDAAAGVAQHQLRGLVLRYHGQHQGKALLGAPALDGAQSALRVAVGAGDGVVKDVLALDAVADDKAARRLREAGVQVPTPHELDAQGVLAQAIVAGFVIPAQLGAVL